MTILQGDLQNESDASGSESGDIDPNTMGNFDSDMSGESDDDVEHSESEVDEEKGQASENSENNSEDSHEYADPESQTHSGYVCKNKIEFYCCSNLTNLIF